MTGVQTVLSDFKSYGMFENFKLNFQDGINLIYGLNESGKSTIHSFIKEVFYGFTKPNLRINKFSTDYERYKPWNKNVFSGSVIIEKDSVKYAGPGRRPGTRPGPAAQ